MEGGWVGGLGLGRGRRASPKECASWGGSALSNPSLSAASHMASSTESAPRCTVCAVHGGGPASAGGSPAREGGRPTEGGSNLVGVPEAEVEGEAAYFAAGEALREEAREVTGEGEGEAAAGGPVTAGGNCAARWQRAASSSTSDQRSCGATPSVVNGMAPPLRRRRGGGTCGYNARDQCFCVGWRAARRLSACASRCTLERLGPPSSPWGAMGQCHHIGHGGGGHFQLAAARPTTGAVELASTGGGERACRGTVDRGSGGGRTARARA